MLTNYNTTRNIEIQTEYLDYLKLCLSEEMTLRFYLLFCTQQAVGYTRSSENDAFNQAPPSSLLSLICNAW